MSECARPECLVNIITLGSYLGKSTGRGSLAIWTHHLKDIQFFNYEGPHYNGKAIKMGAGVQGIEAYRAADKVNLAVVGGECPTVGLAGGYTQGGGHSQLSSKYGLAADQALEWEVIDGRGRFLRASRTENTDLYWALSGGGGGTYGVVWSLTSKAHQDIPVSVVNLTFTNEGGASAEQLLRRDRGLSRFTASACGRWRHEPCRLHERHIRHSSHHSPWRSTSSTRETSPTVSDQTENAGDQVRNHVQSVFRLSAGVYGNELPEPCWSGTVWWAIDPSVCGREKQRRPDRCGAEDYGERSDGVRPRTQRL